MPMLPDDERLRLVGGPYYPPAVRRGDWLHDEIRGLMQVGGYTESARIPWPRVKRTGLASLIFCGDLVRAVQTESAIAIMHWWGPGSGVVARWRKHLGISQAGTEGTMRLYQEYYAHKLPEDVAARGREAALCPEARAKIAAAHRGIPMPPQTRQALLAAVTAPKSAEWVAQMRETQRRQWAEGERQPPVWTPKMDAWLLRLWAKGLSAAEVAEIMGKTRHSILGRLANIRRS